MNSHSHSGCTQRGGSKSKGRTTLVCDLDVSIGQLHIRVVIRNEDVDIRIDHKMFAVVWFDFCQNNLAIHIRNGQVNSATIVHRDIGAEIKKRRVR